MAVRHRDRRTPSELRVTALVVIIAHWQLLVVSRAWPDGQAFGSRLFSDVLVWVLILGAMVVAGLAKRGFATRSSRVQLAALALALAASVFINTRGAYEKATWHWDWLDRPPGWAKRGEQSHLRPNRVWNWRYPQFMAGLLPRDARGKTLRKQRAFEKENEVPRSRE